MPRHSGRWFEELPVGLVIEHAITRTVTETDNVLFSTMTMNPAALHLDYAAAAEGPFGKPLVNSLFTLGLVIGISVHELTHGTTVANLGFTDVTFPAPVFIGDTIAVRSTVVAARLSASKPTQGIVTFEHLGLNQHDVVVCRCNRQALMHIRPADA
jgi:acyl dehydratase